MKYLYKRYTVESEKNGTIIVQWLFGTLRLYTGGSQQSGPYVGGLWKDAVQRLTNKKDITSVLMMGLGGACAWPMLDTEFPDAHISVIEWDETMVGLAKSFKRWKHEPEIIVGDICEVLPSLPRQYDLILDDAFYGSTPEDRIAHAGCGEALQRALTPGGIFILNASENLKLIESLQTYLRLVDTWVFRENTVAMFAQK